MIDWFTWDMLVVFVFGIAFGHTLRKTMNAFAPRRMTVHEIAEECTRRDIEEEKTPYRMMTPEERQDARIADLERRVGKVETNG